MKTCLSVMLIRQGWWPLISSICSQVRRIWVNHCDKDDIKSDSTSMRFSYETFIATSKDCMTKEVVSLFLSIQWSIGVFNDWLPNQSTSTIIGSYSTNTYHWGGSGHFNLSYHLPWFQNSQSSSCWNFPRFDSPLASTSTNKTITIFLHTFEFYTTTKGNMFVL